ncbi:MAG: FecR family protein, partial [Prolixibacteraceae bacterium]
ITAKGSRTSLTLADGTKIWLNSSSKLVYPQQFRGNTREVYLEGEGYFEVAPNKQKPFYVKAGAIDVNVTGTIFNLKNYPEDNIIETTLIEGEVIIEKNEGDRSEELITLEPNQKITFHKSSESYQLTESGKEKEKVQDQPIQKIEKAVLVENANIEKAISWKNNIIIFENEPFYEIVHNLERRFGVNIIFRSESIKQLRFSGTFEEISIEQALEAMQFASPFNYTIEKDTIFISDKN